MAEPLGVAFIEIEPVAPNFRAKTEAQLRTQLAGSGAAAKSAAVSQQALTTAESEGAVAANRKAAAEARAVVGTRAHAAASREAAEAILAETASVTGLRGASLGVNPVFLAATAASILFFKSAESAGEFTEQMHLIEAATHASGEEMDEAAKKARQFGQDLSIPAASGLDAATAIADLTRAGNTLEASEQAARAVLLLHSSANIDLAASTDIVTRLLRAYNIDAADATRVTDALTSATLSGAGSTEDWASALQTLAPLAHSLGFDIADTTTLLIQAGQAGISASGGTTLLRLALARLSAGTTPVKDGLESIHLTLRDIQTASGQIRPDAFLVIGDAIRDLDVAQQGQALAAIFGARAGSRLLPIIQQTGTEYQRANERAKELGTTQRQAEARAQSLGGASRELGGEISDLGTSIGRLTAPFLTNMVGGLAEGFHLMNQGIGIVSDLFGTIGGAPLDVGKATTSIKDLKDELADLQEKTKLQIKLQGFVSPELQEEIDRVADELDHRLHPAMQGAAADADRVKGAMRDLGFTLDDTAAKFHGLATTAQQGSLAVAQAQASGDQNAELAALRAQEARQQAFVDRQALLPQTPKRVANEIKANQNLASTRAQIKSILDERVQIAQGIQSDREQAASQIEKVANDRDRAFISRIENRRADREGAVTAAAADEALQNDIRANIKLRNWLTHAIADTRARIQEVRAAGRATADLVAELASLRKGKNAVIREIIGLQASAKAQANATRLESAQLDVQILEARAGTDPTKAQTAALVAAHRRVIAALKLAQRLAHGRKLEVKRLQVQIEQELAAIRDLKSAQSEASSEGGADFSKQAFAFLQTLHGFSSNLASNLLPRGSTIGGSTTTSTASDPSAIHPFPSPFEQRAGSGRGSATTAREKAGGTATFGQMQELLHVTKHTNALLGDIRRGLGHPEARHVRAQSRHPVETGVE